MGNIKEYSYVTNMNIPSYCPRISSYLPHIPSYSHKFLHISHTTSRNFPRSRRAYKEVQNSEFFISPTNIIPNITSSEGGGDGRRLKNFRFRGKVQRVRKRHETLQKIGNAGGSQQWSLIPTFLFYLFWILFNVPPQQSQDQLQGDTKFPSQTQQ